MGLGRLQRTAFAAWLGVLALCIQTFVPILVAVEIDLALAGGEDNIFRLCAFGHIHDAAPPHEHGEHAGHDHAGHDHAAHDHAAHQPEGKSPASAPEDEDSGATCPLCVALMGSAVFTTPALAFLPLPSSIAHATAAAVATPATASILAAAYRSRAPPPG